MASENALPGHVEDSVQVLSDVHQQHYRTASSPQRMLDRITSRLARPITLIILSVAIAVWVGAIAITPGDQLRDPYSNLELCATITALLIAVLILVTQTRQDELAQRREQLTLELALIADKRMAKLVGLVEQVRSGASYTTAAVDPIVEEMTTPIDAVVVLEELDRRANDRGQSHS